MITKRSSKAEARRFIAGIKRRARSCWDNFSPHPESEIFADLTPTDRTLLTDLGLPMFVAPNMYLCEADESELHGTELLVGKDRDNRPIYLSLSSGRVAVMAKNRQHLMASSVSQLFLALFAYSDMVEQAIAVDNRAAVDNRVELRYITALEEELRKLSADLVDNDSFWSQEIRRLTDRKDFYE